MEPFRLDPGATPPLVHVPHADTHLPAEIRDRMTPAGRALIETHRHVLCSRDACRISTAAATAGAAPTTISLDRYPGLLKACRIAVDGQAHATSGSAAEPRPGAGLGIAPHSLRAVPHDQLAELTAAVETGCEDPPPIHLHVAEQRREVADCARHLGSTPAAWVLENASPLRWIQARALGQLRSADR